MREELIELILKCEERGTPLQKITLTFESLSDKLRFRHALWREFSRDPFVKDDDEKQITVVMDTQIELEINR